MPTADELRQRYRGYSDPELRELVDAGESSFTPEAWTLLKGEFDARSLTVRPSEPVVPESAVPESTPAVTQAAHVYPKAPIGRRVVAAVIDNFITAAPFIPLALLFDPDRDSLFLNVGFAAAVGWGLFYAAFKDSWKGGQSIGKRVMGLRVVQLDDGAACTAGASCLRFLPLGVFGAVGQVAAAGSWPSVFGLLVLVEPILVVARRDGRRLGDRIAGTQVVHN